MNMMTAVAALPATELGTSAEPRDRWAAALAQWQRCYGEADAADRRIAQAEAAYEAARPKLEEIDPEVWNQLSPFISDSVGRDMFVRTVDLDKLQLHATGEGKHELQAALDRLRRWREADAKAERESGLSVAAKACDAAREAESAARKRLMQTPAPSEQEALWKLEQLFGEQALQEEEDDYLPTWNLDFCRQFFDDVRRLLSERAA